MNTEEPSAEDLLEQLEESTRSGVKKRTKKAKRKKNITPADVKDINEKLELIAKLSKRITALEDTEKGELFFRTDHTSTHMALMDDLETKAKTIILTDLNEEVLELEKDLFDTYGYEIAAAEIEIVVSNPLMSAPYQLNPYDGPFGKNYLQRSHDDGAHTRELGGNLSPIEFHFLGDL